jgi:hypothetical protein
MDMEGTGIGFDVYLEGMSKTMKHLSQDSRRPGRNLKPVRPEYIVAGLVL